MVINPIVGVYIPIIRIPIKGWMTIPNTRSLDPGTCNVKHTKGGKLEVVILNIPMPSMGLVKLILPTFTMKINQMYR